MLLTTLFTRKTYQASASAISPFLQHGYFAIKGYHILSLIREALQRGSFPERNAPYWLLRHYYPPCGGTASIPLATSLSPHPPGKDPCRHLWERLPDQRLRVTPPLSTSTPIFPALSWGPSLTDSISPLTSAVRHNLLNEEITYVVADGTDRHRIGRGNTEPVDDSRNVRYTLDKLKGKFLATTPPTSPESVGTPLPNKYLMDRGESLSVVPTIMLHSSFFQHSHRWPFPFPLDWTL